MANYDYQYELRFDEEIPEDVTPRSLRWTKLRAGLATLYQGKHKTVTVIIDENDPENAETRVRAAVYTWSKAVNLKDRNLKARTVARRAINDNDGMDRVMYVWLEHIDGSTDPNEMIMGASTVYEGAPQTRSTR